MFTLGLVNASAQTGGSNHVHAVVTHRIRLSNVRGHPPLSINRGGNHIHNPALASRASKLREPLAERSLIRNDGPLTQDDGRRNGRRSRSPWRICLDFVLHDRDRNVLDGVRYRLTHSDVLARDENEIALPFRSFSWHRLAQIEANAIILLRLCSADTSRAKLAVILAPRDRIQSIRATGLRPP